MKMKVVNQLKNTERWQILLCLTTDGMQILPRSHPDMKKISV
jgi:hypothetical protein